MKYEIVYEPTVGYEGSGGKWQELKPGIVRLVQEATQCSVTVRVTCRGKCQAHEHKEIVPQVKRST